MHSNSFCVRLARAFVFALGVFAACARGRVRVHAGDGYGKLLVITRMICSC